MKIHATTKTLNRKINRVCSELRFKTPTVLISRDESCLVHFWKSVYHDACDSYSLWCLGYIYIYTYLSATIKTRMYSPPWLKQRKLSRHESCLLHFLNSVYHDACDSYSLWCLGYIYIYIFVSNHQNTHVFPSMVKTTKAEQLDPLSHHPVM